MSTHDFVFAFVAAGGGCKELTSGARQAVCPFKGGERIPVRENGGERSSHKEDWEEGESLRVCPHLSKPKDVATLRKKSAFTWQPFPKCTHTSCLNLEILCGNHQLLHKDSTAVGP